MATLYRCCQKNKIRKKIKNETKVTDETDAVICSYQSQLTALLYYCISASDVVLLS